MSPDTPTPTPTRPIVLATPEHIALGRQRRSPWSCVLVASVFLAAEFGWKYSGEFRSLRWPLSILVWTLALLAAGGSITTWRTAKSLPAFAFLAWLAWNEVAVLWADDVRNSQLLTFGLVAAGLCGVWFASVHGWDRFARVIVVTGAVFEVGSLIADVFDYPATRAGRLIGLGWGYNDTGIVASITTVLGVSISRRRPLISVPVFILGLIVQINAESRMALVATGVGVVIILVHHATGARALVLQMLTVALIGFGVLVVVGDTPIGKYVARTETADVSTFTGRSEVWRAAVDQIARTPILGIGSKDNEGFFTQAATRGDVQLPIFHAHNALLETVLETGLIGGFLLSSSVLGYALSSRRRAPRAPGRDAAIVVLVILGATEALVAQSSLAVLVLGAAVGSIMSGRTTAT